MKKKLVTMMGIVCMLAATACGGKETPTTTPTPTPQPITSGDSVTTSGDISITSGDSKVTSGDSHSAHETEISYESTEQPNDVSVNEADPDMDGVVTEPPTYDDVVVDDSLGEITVEKVSEDVTRVPVVIRDIDVDRLRLLVGAYGKEAKKYIGEASFISSEGAKIKDMDGKKLTFEDLQPGSVIYVEITGVLESEPSQSYTENIILIQK